MRTLLVLMALSATAYAQAPGQLEPAPSRPSVMARRWAVSAGLASQTLRAEADGEPEATFGLLELAGRFRIRPAIELGLALVAGGGMKGQLETGGLYLDFRYRFLAERPWNVYGLVGLGVVSVANDGASDDDHKGRGSLRLGVGVERRFTAFGIHAELRLVGVGENDAADEPMEITPAWQMARHKLSGGSLSLGGTFYF